MIVSPDRPLGPVQCVDQVSLAANPATHSETSRREAEEEARLEREAIQAESDGETTAADFFAGEAA